MKSVSNNWQAALILTGEINCFWLEMRNRPLQLSEIEGPLFFCCCGKSAAIVTVNFFQSRRRYAAGQCDRDGPQNTSQFPGKRGNSRAPPLFSALGRYLLSVCLVVWINMCHCMEDFASTLQPHNHLHLLNCVFSRQENVISHANDMISPCRY